MLDLGATLVLALGNPLVRDDGVGGEVVRSLEEHYVVPAGVDLVDGGTMGLYLLDRVARYDRVLVVDSVAADEPPGTVLRLAGDEVQAVFAACLSPHQAGLTDLLAAVKLLERPIPEVVAIGVVPSCLDVGLGLSDAVRGSVGAAVEAVVDQLRRWGHSVPRRGR